MIDNLDMPSLLVVDDDETFRSVLVRAMERRGFAVSSADSVESALRALAGQPSPEFAIVDLKMPGASGLELIERLIELDPATRIVMLTGFASVATAIEAIKLGAVHYLVKPVDADQIVAAFSRLNGDANVAPATSPLSVGRLEWEHIQKVLVDHNSNISATAKALKMHRRTLQRKLNKRPVRE